MPGIYVMASLTIGVTALLCVIALNQLTQSSRQYYWLIIAGLPLSLIANRFIKTPVIVSLAAGAGIPLKLELDAPFWFIVIVWLNAPIREEAIKLLAIVLPAARISARSFFGALGRSCAWHGFWSRRSCLSGLWDRSEPGL